MTIKEIVTGSGSFPYNPLCSALIERFGVKQPVKWDSVLPHEQQQTLFGGEILRLISDHPTLANQKEIRPVCLMKGELSQLLFFYIQLKDENLPKSAIERIARKFVGGAAADRYIIWFFGSKTADVLKIVISGKEGKKIRLKTLALEAGQWFKTYDYILSEVERKFNHSNAPAFGTPSLLKRGEGELEPSGLWKAIWDAFDISIVNKKFYAEIKAIFDALTKEELPKCKGLLTKEQDRVQFAIRLIGRIIFCWFLKRKGIITGDVMSSRAVEAEQNYYRDILEPLFFDVFNTPLNERKKDLPDSIKNYPFLNGGLFEPQHQDHKGNWALTISNNWFMNFFNNTLERYNFTVDENSAASSEIAIDPEMLGRIFENLLAEQTPETGEPARKSTGSYYTPREIVDFMVEESLIAYLKTNVTPPPSAPPLKIRGGRGSYDSGEGDVSVIPIEALEDFVHTGTLPDALKSHGKELLDKLNAIKVLDPACGSGAFPISMLQKLAGLKQQLDSKASPYDLKLKTIENSIYGVDIQPMATELSRLRCWLSLIVDEDPKDIKPLPNLDFKFVTANSLIDLGYEEFIRTMQTKKSGGLLLIANFLKDLDALKAVRQKYFEPSLHQREKDKLKKEFNAIRDDLFKMALELIKQRLLDAEFANKVTGWDPFDDSKPAPFFNKSWMFGVEDGFDIVIANPPYVRQESIKSFKDTFRNLYDSYDGRADLYVYFYERGLRLLRNNGVLVFISSNKYFRAGYGKSLRNLLATKSEIIILIDFGDLPVFDATAYPSVFLARKKEKSYAHKLLTAKIETVDELGQFSSVIDRKVIARLQEDLTSGVWQLSAGPILELLKKIEQHGTPLASLVENRIYAGIKTGFNEAFVIDNKTRIELIQEDQKSSELIKTFIKGKDITRWASNTGDRFLIYSHHGINIEEYPAIKRHLLPFKQQLEKRALDQQWFELQQPQYAFSASFSGTKIVYPNVALGCKFAIDEGSYLDMTSFCICSSDRLLLAILNSQVMSFYFSHLGIERRGGYQEFKTQYVKQLPIPTAAISQRPPIVRLVETILSNPDSPDIPRLEAEINNLVYALYGLTPEEIAVVEGKE